MNPIRTAPCFLLVLLLSNAAMAQPASAKKARPSRPAATKTENPTTPSAKPPASAPAPDVQHPITVIMQPPTRDDATEKAIREREVAAQERTATVTVVLAFLAFLTGGVVAWQAWETRKSVKVAKDTIQHSERMDKILHRQWLDVAGWSCDVVAVSENGTVTTRIMKIGCSVENGTTLPLAIETVECFVSNRNKARTVFFNGNPVGPGGRYRVQTTTVMDPEQTVAYLSSSGLGLSIVGRVNYVDVFGDSRPQLFGYFCRLRLGSEPVFRPFDISLTTAWEDNERLERAQKEALAPAQDRETSTSP